MLHINKFKFGLNEDVDEVTQNDQIDYLNYLTKSFSKQFDNYHNFHFEVSGNFRM